MSSSSKQIGCDHNAEKRTLCDDIEQLPPISALDDNLSSNWR
jgi:hypothetical protein